MSDGEKFSVLLGCKDEARCDAWKFCFDDFSLEYAGCLDIEKFELGSGIVFRNMAEAIKGSERFVFTALEVISEQSLKWY
jgi:hypothetical protein